MFRLPLILAASVLVFACTDLRADEPKKPAPEKIPAPKVEVAPAVIVPYVQRTDTREVWQHYGVNAQGRFVQRVLLFPEGAYYSRTLDPYPWPRNRPSAVLPRVTP
jgi:hypothetical protein